MIVEVIHEKQALGDREIPLRTPLEINSKETLLEFEHGFSEAGYFWTTIHLARELGEEGRAGVFIRSDWRPVNGYCDHGTNEVFVPFEDIVKWVEENV